MLKNELIDVVKRRLAFDPEDYINVQKCWDVETEILSRDMAETINFIENECDDETFCWIGEVFEDVADRTQSKDFLVAITKRAAKVVNPEARRSVETDVRYASYKFDDD